MNLEYNGSNCFCRLDIRSIQIRLDGELFLGRKWRALPYYMYLLKKNYKSEG